MNNNEINPVWIINTQEEHGDFCEKVNRQFVAFSKNELDSFNESTSRWWRVDNISDIKDLKIDALGHPEGVPAYGLPMGNFDVSTLTVVVLGSMASFEKAIDVVEDLRAKKAADSFMRGAGNLVRFYGITVFSKGDALNDKLREYLIGDTANTKSKKAKTIKSLPFDTLFLQGDCNQVESNVLYAYDHLRPLETVDLSVQLVFHLALTQGVLSNVNNNSLCVAGAYSINYEPKKERARIAEILAEDIAEDFVNNETGEFWHKESAATLSKSFELDLGWKSIYGSLKTGYQDLSTDELIPQSQISPWALFAKLLIPQYFRKYIKGLTRQVRSNLDGFSFLTLEKFKNHVENQYASNVEDSVQRKRIEDELSSIWDITNQNNKNNHPIGMKQFVSRLLKMKYFFEEQKNTVERLINGKTADGKNNSFPELADYPLGGFGEFQGAYSAFVNSLGVVGNKKEGGSDSKGDGILNKIIRILRFHPVPLSLLLRSILLGILLPMVLLTIMRIIPDVIIDTSWLETQPGSVVLVASCFLICVLWAVLKYHFGTVDRVKVKLKEYVGWRLYRLQMSAYQELLKKEIDYYENALAIVADVEKMTGEFVNGVFKADKTSDNLGFAKTKFQSSVLGEIEEKAILNEDVVISKIATSFDEYGSEVTKSFRTSPNVGQVDELRYGVLRRILLVKNDGLLKLLKEKLFTSAPSPDNAQEGTIDQADFMKELSSSICEDIVFYLGDVPINSLTDIVCSTTALSQSVNKWEVGKGEYHTTFDIIRGLSYPSAETTSAFHFTSLLMPNRLAQNPSDFDMWRKLLKLDHETVDNRYAVHKGAFVISILRGAAIPSISRVKDIKI